MEDSPIPDSPAAGIACHQRLAAVGVRSLAVAAKIALHLGRFQAYFAATYGHDHLSACVRRDAQGWQAQLRARPLALATVNNHLTSLAGSTSWVAAQAPAPCAVGNPGAPGTPAALRTARRGRISRVRGKVHTERVVFLSAAARAALAAYPERERPGNAGPDSQALFLSAAGLPDGCLSPRALNELLARMGPGTAGVGAWASCVAG